MKIQVESTDLLTDIDGAQVRLWNGVTEGGVPCKVFVHCLAVAAFEDAEQFDRELSEQLPPGHVIDLRMIL